MVDALSSNCSPPDSDRPLLPLASRDSAGAAAPSSELCFCSSEPLLPWRASAGASNDRRRTRGAAAAAALAAAACADSSAGGAAAPGAAAAGASESKQRRLGRMAAPAARPRGDSRASSPPAARRGEGRGSSRPRALRLVPGVEGAAPVAAAAAAPSKRGTGFLELARGLKNRERAVPAWLRAVGDQGVSV
jgi:hypothetical protein